MVTYPAEVRMVPVVLLAVGHAVQDVHAAPVVRVGQAVPEAVPQVAPCKVGVWVAPAWEVRPWVGVGAVGRGYGSVAEQRKDWGGSQVGEGEGPP